LPIPNGQQNHLHQNQWSTRNHQACKEEIQSFSIICLTLLLEHFLRMAQLSFSIGTLGAPTVQPAANDQTFFSIGTNLGAPTVPPGANDHWFPYSDPACKEDSVFLS